jgi:hypothetical protein
MKPSESLGRMVRNDSMTYAKDNTPDAISPLISWRKVASDVALGLAWSRSVKGLREVPLITVGVTLLVVPGVGRNGDGRGMRGKSTIGGLRCGRVSGRDGLHRLGLVWYGFQVGRVHEVTQPGEWGKVGVHCGKSLIPPDFVVGGMSA